MRLLLTIVLFCIYVPTFLLCRKQYYLLGPSQDKIRKLFEEAIHQSSHLVENYSQQFKPEPYTYSFMDYQLKLRCGTLSCVAGLVTCCG